jgi:ATP-binding cassette subfamily B multidrug efflux pump
LKRRQKMPMRRSVKSESTMMLLSPLILLLTNMLILVILYMGGGRAQTGTIKLGVLIGLIEYATISLSNIQQFASIITIIPRSKVSIDRISEVLSTEELLNDQRRQLGIGRKRHSLSEYRFLLSGFSQSHLEKHQFPSGKGRDQGDHRFNRKRKIHRSEAIAARLRRLSGADLPERQEHSNLSREEISRAVTFVPQSSFLFSGSIRENIQTGKKDAATGRFGKFWTWFRWEIFLENLRKGWTRYIAQNAVNFSGGQKQRISIARGLIRESDFYVFDDCFSALDYSTEKKIRKAIREKLADRGVLVVAQRVWRPSGMRTRYSSLKEGKLQTGEATKSLPKARRFTKKSSLHN